MGKSLLGSLQPLTPETAAGVEDMLAIEAMTIHGVLGSGKSKLCAHFLLDNLFVFVLPLH